MSKFFDFTTIIMILFAFLLILIIFRFCKCKKSIEGFKDLDDMVKNNDIKGKLHESFVNEVDSDTMLDYLDDINGKAMDMMGSIQKLRDMVTSKQVEEEVDVTEEQKEMLDELNSIKLDLEEENEEDEDDRIEDDDAIEGFIEHTSHNCSMLI